MEKQNIITDQSPVTLTKTASDNNDVGFNADRVTKGVKNDRLKTVRKAGK